MSLTYKTIGVYINELDDFGNAVVPVPTAIPAFVGYTEKAESGGRSLQDKPTKISSFEEYVVRFGGAFKPKFKLNPKSQDTAHPAQHLVTINGEEMAITYKDDHEFYMFRSLKLFFSNGGGHCYIVSVDTYKGKPNGVEIKKEKLLRGLETLSKEQEPTIIVVPDAVQLSADDCYEVYSHVLKHCGMMRNRVAIFDIHNGGGARKEGLEGDVIDVFRNKTGKEYLSYGVAYYPWLHTSVFSKEQFTFENLDESIELLDMIPETSAKKLIQDFITGQSVNKEEVIFEDESMDYKSYLHQGLLQTSPTYTDVLNKITEIENLLPPSAAMAGVFTTVDNTRGVWKSPANISLSSVVKPSYNISQKENESLNVDIISGKSINTIRVFPGLGTLVWGARTLDGNSNDYKYINVRRTLIYIEQSIKEATKVYVFAPNEATTWAKVEGIISHFLTEVWKQGGLAGPKPSDAFSVHVGLGTTMTSDDIKQGIMRVSAMVAVSHPAEFIILTIQQEMQKA